jgi:gas vesicle protein
MTGENRMNYLFVGFGLGTAIGMLFAPKAGVETRNSIQGRIREGHKYFKRQGQELLGSATNTVGHGKQVLRNHMQGLSEAVAAGKVAYLRKVG